MRTIISIAQFKRKKAHKGIAPFIEAMAAKKAEHVAALDISAQSGYADWLVIATATSSRHAQTLADELERVAGQAGRRTTIEGYRSDDWLLVDAGDIVFHIFTHKARENFDIEGMWFDAPIYLFLEKDGQKSG